MTRALPLIVLLTLCAAPALAKDFVQAQAGKPPSADAAIARATAPKGAPVDPATAIAKANAYFNTAGAMVGDFVQIGYDGRRTEGKLYVLRPGRMRFEYAKPATIEIIADGTSVAVRDRKLATQDLYLIGQTPLKFLLKEHIDLNKDVKVLDVSSDANGSAILVEDKTTLGGSSKIKLMFDPVSFALKQWTVTDPQGYDTLVSLFNMDLSKKPDLALFKIDQERMLNPN